MCVWGDEDDEGGAARGGPGWMGFLCDRGIVGLAYITGGDSLEGNSSREVGGSLSHL